MALLLLTGCRKRELLEARWDEFQLDRQMWRIPMERAKTSQTRHVPLPKAALFMLVSALMGPDRMQAACKHAIGTGSRFYSHGDGSLLLP